MKLQFKSQQYQSDATQAVVDVFYGQSKGFRKDMAHRKMTKITMMDKEYIDEEISYRFSNNPQRKSS